MRSTNPTSVLCRPPCSLKNINYLLNEPSNKKEDSYLFSFANELSRNHSKLILDFGWTFFVEEPDTASYLSSSLHCVRVISSRSRLL